jgi:hypothetical protein
VLLRLSRIFAQAARVNSPKIGPGFSPNGLGVLYCKGMYYHEKFKPEELTPEVLDQLLALGWYRMKQTIFFYLSHPIPTGGSAPEGHLAEVSRGGPPSPPIAQKNYQAQR